MGSNLDIPPGFQLEPEIPEGFVLEGKQEPHENFLQKAMKMANEVGAVATSAAFPIPHMAQQLAKAPLSGFVGRGAELSSNYQEPGAFNIPLPEAKTTVGNVLSFIAPFILPSLGAGKGIGKLFSKGNLPQEIEATKGGIQDLIGLGPSKVKGRVNQIFDQFQNEFGQRLQNIKGGITNNHFAEALDRTAKEIGASHIAGSPGNKAANMAEAFRNMSTENADRLFIPQEIQAQSKQVLKQFGNDPMLKAKFYNHFTDILSQEIPELSTLKSEYAPVYDIAKQSKFITSGRLGKAAKGSIGPEELGQMTQAQQMMGDEPNIVEQAVSSGRKLGQQQNQLQKIIGRQKRLKDLSWTAAKYTGIGEILHQIFRKRD